VHDYYTTALYNPETEAGSERIQGSRVTPSFFELVNVQPVLGRLPIASDADGSNGDTILISYELWQDKFEANVDAVGLTVFLNDKPHTIIGILPDGFQYPVKQNIWKPYDWRTAKREGQETLTRVQVLATPKPDIAIEKVKAELNNLAGQIHQAHPDSHKKRTRMNFELHSPFGPVFRSTILMLLFGSILVLLTACANISNLLLARVNARQFELGMRKVLGARRREIAIYVVLDAFVISFIGLMFAFIMAAWFTRFIWEELYQNYGAFTPYWWNMDLDGSVFAYGAGVMLLSVFAASLSALVQLMRRFQINVIKDDGRTTSGLNASGTGRFLITCQVFLAAVLLTTAGVYSLWLQDLQDHALPFDPDQVLFNHIFAPTGPFKSAESVDTFFADVERSIRNVEGIKEVAFAFDAMDNDRPKRKVHIEGREFDEETSTEAAATNIVSSGYFQTFQALALEGRFFNDFDDKESLPIAVVDAAFAKHYFPDESPIGKRIRVKSPGNEWEKQNKLREDPWTEWLTIVGVSSQIESLKGYGNAKKGGREWEYHNVYIPMKQWTSRPMYLMVTGEGDVHQYANAVSQAITKVKPTLAPTYRYQSLNAYLDMQNSFFNLVSSLVTIFGLVSLTMAAVGLYGIASFSTQKKTKDFAIRRALGATKQHIIQLVLQSAYWQLAIGLSLGLAASFYLQKIIAVSLKFAETTNVGALAIAHVYLSTSAAICAIMLLSVFIPAWRVANNPPNVALRAG